MTRKSKWNNLAIKAFFENIQNFSDRNLEENLVEVAIKIINEANSSGSSRDYYLYDKLDDLIESSEYFRKLLWRPEWLINQTDEFKNKMIYKSSCFIQTLGSKFFFENFYEKYSELIKEEHKTDPEYSPKWFIANDIHSVVKNLGAVECFSNDFEKNVTTLMTDKLLPVLGSLLQNLHVISDILFLPEVTDEMTELGLDKKVAGFKSTFMKNFIKIEDKVKDNWRYVNLWIDWAFRIMHHLHETDPPSSSKTEGTTAALK